MGRPIFTPLGDMAVVIEFAKEMSLETNQVIIAWKRQLEQEPFPGFVEAVPAYTTLTVFYDPMRIPSSFPFAEVKEKLIRLGERVEIERNEERPILDIPVYYGPPYGPDLPYVAEYAGLTEQEVIEIHSGQLYDVYFLGFAPGFPFLGGMDKRIAVPRKDTPRLRVEKGSVGIAGEQTGIYPNSSPGGWQIIGRTSLSLFDPANTPPALVTPGIRLRFQRKVPSR